MSKRTSSVFSTFIVDELIMKRRYQYIATLAISITLLLLLIAVALNTSPSNDETTIGDAQSDDRVGTLPAITFTLNQVSVASSLTGETINYSFQSRIEYLVETEKINESTILITSDKFEIVVKTPMESFGGIMEALSITPNISNMYNIDIVRVKDPPLGFVSTEFGTTNSKENLYYYAEADNSVCSQLYDVTHCGNFSIPIPGQSSRMEIYCAVNESTDVKYCDEFITNLELVSNETVIRLVSDYR